MIGNLGCRGLIQDKTESQMSDEPICGWLQKSDFRFCHDGCCKRLTRSYAGMGVGVKQGLKRETLEGMRVELPK